MKKFKVVFVKYAAVLGLGTPPIMNLIEQTYYSNTDSFKMEVPQGYQVLSVTQVYPDVFLKLKSDESN